MDTIIQHQAIIATFTIRVLLGILFFFQGYDALVRVKVRNIVLTYSEDFSSRGIPAALTAAGVWFTSLTELIGGFLLIIGLFQPLALYLLALNLILAGAAFSFVTAMWDMRHVFPRVVMLVFLLLAPADWHCCGVDQFIFR